MARSTFYYNLKASNRKDQYLAIKKRIVEIYNQHNGRYGYRRITIQLCNEGCHINHKTVFKLMKDLGLKAIIREKKYRSYRGEIGKIAPNIINRDFSCDKPYTKLATDVTEVKINGVKGYISPIMDMYNGEILEKHLSFVYDGYKLIEERNALDNNAAVRKYVWQPEALVRDVPLTVYDVVSEKTYYYHTDANKNVTELSDESGNVVAHYEYSPFGSLTKITGDYATNNPFRFSSEYYDEETGLVYYNYRYYNPELGRWISRDPIEEEGGYNLYGMIGNNLLNNWDIWGQKTKLHNYARSDTICGNDE